MNLTLLFALLGSPFGQQLLQGLFGNGTPQAGGNAGQSPIKGVPASPVMTPPIIQGSPSAQPTRTTQPVAQRTPGFGDGFGSFENGFGSFEPGSGTPALQGYKGFGSGGTHNPNVGGMNGTTGATATNPGMGQSGLGTLIASKFMPGLSGLYGGGSMGLQTFRT